MNDRGFHNDNAIGAIGENFYKDILLRLEANGNIASFLDLRESLISRLVDCDFAVFTTKKENGEYYSVKDIEEMILNRELPKEGISLVEVKTDTRINETENVFLEWIMHESCGCFAITRADTWVYCGLDGDGNVNNMWLINIRKLRRAIVKNSINSDDKYFDAKKCIYADKISIETMIDMGIARKYDKI